ncbi:MAG: hypothetical protein RIE08_08840 [Acidimicrobiales bacterium]
MAEPDEMLEAGSGTPAGDLPWPTGEDRVLYSPGDPCPRCGSDRVVEVVYGMPGPDVAEASRRGEVALGGCCIGFDDPTHRCLDCEADLWDRPDRMADITPTPSAEDLRP